MASSFYFLFSLYSPLLFPSPHFSPFLSSSTLSFLTLLYLISASFFFFASHLPFHFLPSHLITLRRILSLYLPLSSSFFFSCSSFPSPSIVIIPPIPSSSHLPVAFLSFLRPSLFSFSIHSHALSSFLFPSFLTLSCSSFQCPSIFTLLPISVRRTSFFSRFSLPSSFPFHLFSSPRVFPSPYPFSCSISCSLLSSTLVILGS